MRYLFVLVIFCMPTWVAANLLVAETSYSYRYNIWVQMMRRSQILNFGYLGTNMLLNPLHKNTAKRIWRFQERGSNAHVAASGR